MKIYTVHGTDGDTFPDRFIGERFSWTAFLLAPAWALAHGLWRDLVLLIAAWAVALVFATLIAIFAVGESPDPAGVSTTWLILGSAVQAVYGHLAMDRLRARLRRHGIYQLGVVSAETEEHAAHVWLERHPRHAAALA